MPQCHERPSWIESQLQVCDCDCRSRFNVDWFSIQLVTPWCFCTILSSHQIDNLLLSDPFFYSFLIYSSWIKTQSKSTYSCYRFSSPESDRFFSSSWLCTGTVEYAVYSPERCGTLRELLLTPVILFHDLCFCYFSLAVASHFLGNLGSHKTWSSTGWVTLQSDDSFRSVEMWMVQLMS